jgi:hypothetical protein
MHFNGETMEDGLESSNCNRYATDQLTAKPDKDQRSEGQLLRRAPKNQGLRIWLKLEKHNIPNNKLTLSPMLISLILHLLLHPNKMLLHRISNDSSLTQPLLNINGRNSIINRNSKIARRVAS